MKLDLLTNATVVEDAIRFVSEKSIDRRKLSSSSTNEEDTKESDEADYNDEKKEDEIDKMVNQIF
jgi:hypothetical protein